VVFFPYTPKEDTMKRKAAPTPKGRIPEGIRYEALKGMSYRPGPREQHRKDRKAVRLAVKRGDW